MKSSSLTNPTKVELQWWDQLREYGCWVCRHHYGITHHDTPEIHHLLLAGRRVSHRHVIPLCTKHHRHGGATWESRHSPLGKSGEAAFTAAYRSDWDMLEYMLWKFELTDKPELTPPPVE